MQRTDTLVIGAGQAGLAMSQRLTARSIDHVLIERGEVANSWRTERWDSLRLLTPNWQSRLPGYGYTGTRPDGFRTMAQTIGLLSDYANYIDAPVQTQTKVTSVEPCEGGYIVRTDRGDWTCRALVLASGACNIAKIPRAAQVMPASIRSISPLEYRNPDQLEAGGVLVVGASASGVQLAQEIHLSGRPVTLACGEHVRMPRTYRGHDIQWWMDVAGILDRLIEEQDDIRRARNVPSPQLIGTPTRETISLNSLQSIGVRIAGRLMAVDAGKAQFSGSLANVCALADLKMNRTLTEIDEWIDAARLSAEVEPSYRLRATQVPDDPLIQMDVEAEGIRTVLWATGFRPDYSWLNVPVLTPKGELRHDRGICEAPGLYALGLPFLRTRKSSLIDGVGQDAAALCAHLGNYLDNALNAAA